MALAFVLAAGSCVPTRDTTQPEAGPENDSGIEDDTSAKDECVADATVRVANGTTTDLSYLWVCSPDACSVSLNGIGVAPGGVWSQAACPDEELLVAVVDASQRCTVSDLFTLVSGDTFDWTVDQMTGTWPEADLFGCVAD